jgi:aminoglycoside 3-N-acetyltransferase
MPQDELGEITKARETSDANFITTKNDLKKALKSLGVRPGMSVMLHSAMKDLGYVVNGPNDLIDAVLETITPKGTMLVSANTSQLTDPSEWKAPAVPKKWIPIIRKNMRPFDAKTTLIRGRGILPLAFLLYPNVFRSAHPVKSIAAKGRLAKKITSRHPFDASEGEGSPIHQLYLQKGYSLMVGVDLVHCTALHLAEYLADVPYLKTPKFKCCVTSGGKNQFKPMKRYPITSKYFYKLHATFKTKGFLKESRYQGCQLILLDVYQAVNCLAGILKNENDFLLKP